MHSFLIWNHTPPSFFIFSLLLLVFVVIVMIIVVSSVVVGGMTLTVFSIVVSALILSSFTIFSIVVLMRIFRLSSFSIRDEGFNINRIAKDKLLYDLAKCSSPLESHIKLREAIKHHCWDSNNLVLEINLEFICISLMVLSSQTLSDWDGTGVRPIFVGLFCIIDFAKSDFWLFILEDLRKQKRTNAHRTDWFLLLMEFLIENKREYVIFWYFIYYLGLFFFYFEHTSDLFMHCEGRSIHCIVRKVFSSSKPSRKNYCLIIFSLKLNNILDFSTCYSSGFH